MSNEGIRAGKEGERPQEMLVKIITKIVKKRRRVKGYKGFEELLKKTGEVRSVGSFHSFICLTFALT